MNDGMIPKVLYIHNLVGPYDKFWIDFLSKHYIVYSSSLGRRHTLKVGGLLGLLRWLVNLPSMFFQLKKVIKTVRPNVLISNYALTYGFLGALSHYRPNVLVIWGSDVLTIGSNPLYISLVKYAIKCADLIIVDSEVQRYKTLMLGAKHEKIFKLPWFDYRYVDKISMQFDRDRVRASLGWDDRLIVISNRSHYPIYSIDTLIEAIPIVIKENRDVRFLIAGSGSETRRLVELAERLGVKKYLKFVGYIPRHKLIGLVKASDIYVSTSLSDGASASLLEAMTLKVPPVVTDIPGNREWVFEGYNGLLFTPRDDEQLAEKILKLCQNGPVRRVFGDRSRRIAISKCDWERNSKELVNRINSLI